MEKPLFVDHIFQGTHSFIFRMLQCMFAGGWFFQRGGWLQEPGEATQVGRAKPQVKHQIHVVLWVCKRELYHILLIWNSMCILTSMQHAACIHTITYIPVLSTNNNEYKWIWIIYIKYIYIIYTYSIDDFMFTWPFSHSWCVILHRILFGITGAWTAEIWEGSHRPNVSLLQTGTNQSQRRIRHGPKFLQLWPFISYNWLNIGLYIL